MEAGRLHVRFTDLDGEEQAAVLHLDPIRDRDEYSVLLDQLESGFETGVSDAGESGPPPAGGFEPTCAGSRRPWPWGRRGHRWPIWSAGDNRTVPGILVCRRPPARARRRPRLAGVALEKAVAAESVLAAFWRRRTEREAGPPRGRRGPQRLPAEPPDPVNASATEHAVRIAGEGRKFGLYLLVSTQRPQTSTPTSFRSATTSS